MRLTWFLIKIFIEMTVDSLWWLEIMGTGLYPSSSGEITAGTLMSHRLPQLHLSACFALYDWSQCNEECLHIPSTQSSTVTQAQRGKPTCLFVCQIINKAARKTKRLWKTFYYKLGSGQTRLPAGLRDTGETRQETHLQKKWLNNPPPRISFESRNRCVCSRWTTTLLGPNI